MNQALRSAALELAAVSGAFEPAALARALGIEDALAHRDALWRSFAANVTEVLPGGKEADGPVYGWLLKPDLRREWLTQFVSRTQLDRALDEAPRPWPGDLFGGMLRALLSGPGEVSIAECSQQDDDAAILAALRHNAAILDAVQFAREVPALDAHKLAALEAKAKHRIQMLQRRRDLTIVLPRRHYGYARARRRLSEHLRGKGTDGRPLLLTGTGGVGKSAVLARLLRHWQRRKAAPVAVILDFDRRQLNGGQPVEILKEVLRQLESGIAGKMESAETERIVAKELNAMRHALPRLTATGDQRSDTSQLGFLTSWLMGPFSTTWSEPLRKRSIALVFDSFEAVDRRGGHIVETIFELESLLRDLLPGLRSVVSGRAEPLDEAQIDRLFGPPARRLELTGLDPRSGARLLADEDRRLAGDGQTVLPDAAGRERISRILDGHPLALLIFAQYAHGDPDDVDRLVADLESDEGFRAEFAQVFLYERILDRIDRPDLKALAHPGLVLRQLNPDLIRFVLAGPCLGEGPDDPAPMTPERAEELHAELRDEYWLVEPGDPPFGLRHRPDLRRLMMPGLFAGPRPQDTPAMAAEKRALHDRAIAVCEAAATYFATGPDAAAEPAARARWEAIDTRLRRVHAIYYLGFCRPDAPEPFDAETAAMLDQDIGEDIDTMPLAWRARINVLVGRTPTPAEMAVLPHDLRERGAEQIFAQQKQHGLGTDSSSGADPFSLAPEAPESLSADDFEALLNESFGAPEEAQQAVKSFADKAAPQPEDRPASAYEREILHAFAAAEFDAIPGLAIPYFHMLARRADEETARRFREAETEGYWRHPLWLCLLVAGAGIGAEDMAATAQSQMTPDSPYAPVYGAIAAAEARDAEVARALHPVFERDILSPVDFNRTRGGRMARWLAGDGETGLDLYPNALCLFAGSSERDDRLTAPLGPFLNENDALLAVRMKGARGLEFISRAYEHPSAQTRASLEPAEGIDEAETEVLRAMLRGLNPDLQMPLAPLLKAMPAGRILPLVEQMRDRARYWPDELRFDDKNSFRSVQATTIVETADQCGVLRDLIGLAAGIDGRLAPLLAMYDCISRWFFPFDLPHAESGV